MNLAKNKCELKCILVTFKIQRLAFILQISYLRSMILYNITFLANDDIEAEFAAWIQYDFLPKLANEAIFKGQSFLKVLDSPNEGATYSLQMISASEKEIERFKSDFYHRIEEKLGQVWKNQLYLFESKMQYIAFH